MIVGFPGETDADFADTLSLTRRGRFPARCSPSSTRSGPNTLAAKRLPDDVPEEEKDRRLAALQELQKGIQADLHEAAVGTTVEVLVDCVSRRRPTELAGRTTGNTVVNFPGEPGGLGALVMVEIRAGGAQQPLGRGQVLTAPGDRPTLNAPTLAGAIRSARHPPHGRRPEQARSTMQSEMVIKGLMVDPVTNMPIVILRDKEGERVLPIWVGIFEANAIALQIENIATPRPMTHDLLRNVIRDLTGDVEKIVVSDLKDNTFYALIYLRRRTGLGRR